MYSNSIKEKIGTAIPDALGAGLDSVSGTVSHTLGEGILGIPSEVRYT